MLQATRTQRPTANYEQSNWQRRAQTC